MTEELKNIGYESDEHDDEIYLVDKQNDNVEDDDVIYICSINSSDRNSSSSDETRDDEDESTDIVMMNEGTSRTIRDELIRNETIIDDTIIDETERVRDMKYNEYCESECSYDESGSSDYEEDYGEDVSRMCEEERLRHMKNKEEMKNDDLLKLLRKLKRDTYQLMLRIDRNTNELEGWNISNNMFSNNDSKNAIPRTKAESRSIRRRIRKNDRDMSELMEYNHKLYKLKMQLECFIGVEDYYGEMMRIDDEDEKKEKNRSYKWVWRNRTDRDDYMEVKIPTKPRILEDMYKERRAKDEIRGRRKYRICV